MRPRVDKHADALNLRLDSSDIVESVEVVPGVVLGHTDDEKVVGVEMLRLHAFGGPGPLRLGRVGHPRAA